MKGGRGFEKQGMEDYVLRGEGSQESERGGREVTRKGREVGRVRGNEEGIKGWWDMGEN